MAGLLAEPTKAVIVVCCPLAHPLRRVKINNPAKTKVSNFFTNRFCLLKVVTITFNLADVYLFKDSGIFCLNRH